MKTRSKIFSGALLLAAMVIGLMVFSSGSSRRAVDAYRKQLRAQGEKLTAGELAPVAPQGSYSNAQSFLAALGSTRSPVNFPPMMRMVAPGRAMVGWQQKVVPADSLPDVWPVLVAELKTFHEVLPDNRAIFGDAILYFDLDYTKGFTMSYAHLAKLKQAEWLAADSAMAALHEHNYPEAWTNLTAAVRLVRRYQTEPLIIGHLVRDAMANIAITVTWEFLQCDEWSDAQLAQLQSEWEGQEFFYVTEKAFEMERASSGDTFVIARKSYDNIQRMLGGGSSGPASLFDDPKQFAIDVYERYPRYWGWKRKWSFEEEMQGMQELTAVAKVIRRVRQGQLFAAAMKDLTRETAEFLKQHTNANAHYLFQGFENDWPSKSLMKYAEAETARRVVVVAIALKRYCLKHGEYPESLEALVPESLQQIPMDFMDGKPLCYKHGRAGNYLLYSVGADGLDDGGDPTPTSQEAMRTKYWLRGRDVVWPVAATTKEDEAYFKAQATNAFQGKPPPAFGNTNVPAVRQDNGK